MYHVAVGGGQPKRRWHLIPFQFYTSRALSQARKAPGNVFAGVIRRRGCYLSVSVWETPADMKRYARSGAHATAHKASAWLVAWFRFHHYQTDEIPTIRAASDVWVAREAARRE
jgi:hypothetical protein